MSDTELDVSSIESLEAEPRPLEADREEAEATEGEEEAEEAETGGEEEEEATGQFYNICSRRQGDQIGS
jgi:hypothetical protein